MESWDDYRILLAIKRNPSLRAAASSLQLNHATLGRRIDRINAASPCPIFEKQAQGLSITPYGQQLLDTANLIESTIDKSERSYQLDSPIAGDISLSIPAAIYEYLLFEEIQQFNADNPSLNLTINTGYNFANLQQREADIVVRVAKDPGDSLVGHRISPISLGYYASPGYLETTPSQRYSWITSPDMTFVRMVLKRSPFPEAPISLKIDDLVIRHKAAAQGQGMIIGAKYIAANMQGLEPISDVFFPYADIWVLTHSELRDVPRIKHCMQFLLRCLRSKSTAII